MLKLWWFAKRFADRLAKECRPSCLGRVLHAHRHHVMSPCPVVAGLARSDVKDVLMCRDRSRQLRYLK